MGRPGKRQSNRITGSIAVLLFSLLLLTTCTTSSPAAPNEPDLGSIGAVSDGASSQVRKKRTTTTTTTTTSTTAPTTVPVTTTSRAPEPVSVIGPWRGVYTPHGWIATPKSADYIADKVRQLRAARFTDQLHNIGTFDVDGRIAATDHSGLRSWIDASRREAPEQRVLAWVNGSESGHVNRPITHGGIAAWVHHAVRDLGVDGVLLNFEPFSRDNPKLLELLDAVRAQAPDAWLGIVAPAEKWSEAFIGSVAARVDLLSPMVYDSTLEDPAAYSELVQRTATTYQRGAAGRSTVALSLPAYAANPWHDPAIENIANAGAGLRAAVAGGAPTGGAAVYWWWEMGPADLASWMSLTG